MLCARPATVSLRKDSRTRSTCLKRSRESIALERFAKSIGTLTAQIFELIPDQEANQVAQLETLDRLARRIAGLGCEVEGGIEFLAREVESGLEIML